MKTHRLTLPLHDGNEFHIDINHNTEYDITPLIEVLNQAHDMRRLLERMCDAYKVHQLLIQNPDYIEARNLLDALNKKTPYQGGFITV